MAGICCFPALIHYSRVARWSSWSVTGFPTPLLISVAHPSQFISPSQCTNALATLITSYSHIWYSFPLLQKAGLFIYLLNRCQQQRTASPWNRSAAAWRRAMGSRLGAWQQSTSSPLTAEIYFFFIFPSIGRVIPVHAKRKLHFNCLSGSFSSSTFVLPQLSNCPFSVSFPFCLSKNKGWTCGCSIRPLQLIPARNIKFNSSAFIISPLFQLYEKQALKEYASCSFIWSARYRQRSSLKTQLLRNYLLCVHPASLSLHTPCTHPPQFMYQTHSTLAFCYLYSGQPLLLKADIKTKSHQHHSTTHLSLF